MLEADAVSSLSMMCPASGSERLQGGLFSYSVGHVMRDVGFRVGCEGTAFCPATSGGPRMLTGITEMRMTLAWYGDGNSDIQMLVHVMMMLLAMVVMKIAIAMILVVQVRYTDTTGTGRKKTVRFDKLDFASQRKDLLVTCRMGVAWVLLPSPETLTEAVHGRSASESGLGRMSLYLCRNRVYGRCEASWTEWSTIWPWDCSAQSAR